MVISLSSYFGIAAKELEKRGVLNAHIGIDNKLFVDPNLLKNTKAPELKGARADLSRYFTPVIKLLKVSKKFGDVAWDSAVKKLIFRENKGTALGYAGPGRSGRGIGPELAERLAQRGKQIIELGIEDSEMFELIGLFEEDFGADLLSDMAVAILRERFLRYTERVTSELKLSPTRIFPFDGKKWLLPVHPDGKKALVFVPDDLLSPLPVALDRSEISMVATFNAEVRAKWNAIVAAARKDKRKPTKTEIREILLATPKNLADLIEVYRKAAGAGYDFDDDPNGLFSWEYIGRMAAEANPLAIPTKQPKNLNELRTVVHLLIAQFKKNVEENKLYEVLYKENGKPRREEFPQLLFFAVADSYCKANNVDLNREPNAGNGPVDFKLSAGYNARLLVELKKSTNSALLHGYETQLTAYEKSEATEESVYLILQMSDNDSSIKDVLALRDKKVKEGARAPDVIVIDARKKLSASKRKGRIR
jgi:hypothetical protein